MTRALTRRKIPEGHPWQPATQDEGVTAAILGLLTKGVVAAEALCRMSTPLRPPRLQDKPTRSDVHLFHGWLLDQNSWPQNADDKHPHLWVPSQLV